MSDYIPDPRRPENKYGTYDYSEEPSNRSGFALVALLGIAALIGGVLMFAKPNPTDQQAQSPDKTMSDPAKANPTTPGTIAVPPKPPAATPSRPQQ